MGIVVPVCDGLQVKVEGHAGLGAPTAALLLR